MVGVGVREEREGRALAGVGVQEGGLAVESVDADEGELAQEAVVGRHWAGARVRPRWALEGGKVVGGPGLRRVGKVGVEGEARVGAGRVESAHAPCTRGQTQYEGSMRS